MKKLGGKRIISLMVMVALLLTQVALVVAAPSYEYPDYESEAVEAPAEVTPVPPIGTIPTQVTRDYSQMSRYEEIIGYLVMLGLIDAAAADTFTQDARIPRGEAADMVVRSTGQYDLARSLDFFGGFVDLRPGDRYAEIVAYAVATGILTGFPGASLNFGDNTTVAQAARMIIGALGYDVRAQLSGGWPQGYLITGTELRLFSGLNAAQYNAEISKMDFAIMLNNALTVPMLRPVRFAPGEDRIVFQTDSDITLESEFLRGNSYVLNTGIVEATRRTTIGTRDRLEDNEIVIGGVRLDATGLNMNILNDFIGYEVEYVAYHPQAARLGRLLRFRVTRNNIITYLTVDNGPEIVGGNRIEFYDMNTGRIRDLRLDPNVIYIHNHRMLTAVTPERLDFTDSNITLINNNRSQDTSINIVRWTTSQSYITGGVREANNFILLDSAPHNGSTSIDVRESDDRIIVVRDVEGNSADWRDIRSGDAISIIDSEDGYYLEIILLPPPVTGRVTEMQAGEWIVIDGERFNVTSQLGDISLGRVGRFFTNENGAVFRFEAGTMDFVFIAAKTINVGLDTSIRVQIYDNDTGINVFYVHDRVMIRDEEGRENVFANAEAAYHAIPVDRVASLTVDANGRVREIDLARPHGGRDTRVYRRYARAFNDATDRTSADGLAFKFNDDTLFFIVPENGNIEDFGAIPRWRDGHPEDVHAFEYDYDTGYVGVIVMWVDTEALTDLTLGPDSTYGIVTRVGQMMDRADQRTFFVEGYANGEPFRHTASHNPAVFSEMGRMRAGDVVRFNTNINNQVVAIEILISLYTEREFFHTGSGGNDERFFGTAMMLRQAVMFDSPPLPQPQVRFLQHELRGSTTTSLNNMATMHIHADVVNTQDENFEFNNYFIFDRFDSSVTIAGVNDIIPYNRSRENASTIFVARSTVDGGNPAGETNILVIVRD